MQLEALGDETRRLVVLAAGEAMREQRHGRTRPSGRSSSAASVSPCALGKSKRSAGIGDSCSTVIFRHAAFDQTFAEETNARLREAHSCLPRKEKPWFLLTVTTGLDPVVHAEMRQQEPATLCNRTRRMDCRVIGERSDAVLRTATPGNDDKRSIPPRIRARALQLPLRMRCEGGVRSEKEGVVPCFLVRCARFATP